MAAVTITPAAGTATKTAFRVSVTGLADTDIGTYDATPGAPPLDRSETAFTYTFIGHEGGNVKLRSHVFTPSSVDGDHTWYNVIVPDAGNWTFAVVRADGATMASVGVVIS